MQESGTVDAAEVVLEDGVVTVRPFRLSDVAIYVSQQDSAMVDKFEWDGSATTEGSGRSRPAVGC